MDNAIQELQNLRATLIIEIDGRIEQIIKTLGDNPDNIGNSFESIYSLGVGTAVFKGKRPTGIIFPNGIRIDCSTWKKIVDEILKDCCRDDKKHQRLIDLCDKIQGKKRVLLGSDDSKMRHPLKIDDNLFIETHYDAETLLKILTTRILDVVDYDYRGIRIAVQSK